MFRVYNFRIFDKKTFRYFYYTELPKVLEPHVIGMHKYDVKRLLLPVRVRIKFDPRRIQGGGSTLPASEKFQKLPM